MKAKILAIMMMLLAFAANVSAGDWKGNAFIGKSTLGEEYYLHSVTYDTANKWYKVTCGHSYSANAFRWEKRAVRSIDTYLISAEWSKCCTFSIQEFDELDNMVYEYIQERKPLYFFNCGSGSVIARIRDAAKKYYEGNKTTTTTKPKSDQKTVASGVTPQEAYNKGKAYFMSHNYSDALTWAKIAADGEYCPAYVMMAEIYESYGSPVDDPSTARYYYSLAAGCASKNTRDYWFSCWRLGTFYEKGLGNVTKDLNKALYYYQQARAYTISSNYPLFDSEVARVKRMLGY